MKMSHKKLRKEKGAEHLISLIYLPLTERITKLLLKTNMKTPNPLSHSIIISAIISGFFFALGEYKYLVIGAVFSQIALIFDLLDGQYARAKNLKTMFGRWYERITNKIMKYFMILGASIGVYRMTNDPLILIIGAIAIFNITLISFISNMRHFFDFAKDHTELPRTKRFFLPFGMLTTTLLTISALFNKISWFLWFFAIFGTLGWMKQIYTHHKLGMPIKIKS